MMSSMIARHSSFVVIARGGVELSPPSVSGVVFVAIVGFLFMERVDDAG